MSRLIGGIDKAVVLSEIHPDGNLPRVFDPVWQLHKGYGLQTKSDALEVHEMFLGQIEYVHKICMRENRALFIRDHLHTDVIANNRMESRLLNVLSGHFDIKKIYTVRDPMDTWASLKLRNEHGDWTFPEFLNLNIKLLDTFSDALILTYESACNDERAFQQAVFEYADMSPEKGDFIGKADQRPHYTGNSGRQGGALSPRPTRWGLLNHEDVKFAYQSDDYRKFCKSLNMKSAFEREPIPKWVTTLIERLDS